MRQQRTRSNDSTFDLNLAPVLDIIVSIIPMLLLSVAYIHVKMIEAPTPQVVSEQNMKEPPKPETVILLNISKVNGFKFEITDKSGKTTMAHVALSGGQLDYENLLASAAKIKVSYPEVTSLQLHPDADVEFEEIVKVMDKIRRKPNEPADLFPDVIFANVGGGA